MNASSFDHFVGGQFAWFTGVVEDVLDPEQMGRVRVRCFGFHTDDKNEIPTESLPWALVMTPITSSSMSGIGRSATGVERGSWVVGFFRDGPSAQDPLVLGTIPSISTGGPRQKGFSDPIGLNPIRPGEVDTPIEARAEYALGSTFQKKESLRQEKVETAVPPRVSTVAVDEPDSYYSRNTWNNLDVAKTVMPSYPQNHAMHTKGGHVIEYDDTPGSKRISEMHASGTYREINDAGDHSLTIVGNGYTVVFGDDNVYIKGSCNLTIDGDLRTLVKGNHHLEVEGNYTENIKGSRQIKVGQSDQKEVGKEEVINVATNRKERIGGELNTIVDGDRKEMVGGASDVLVKGDDSHLVMSARKEYTAGQIDMSGSSVYNINAAGEMNVETMSNLNMLTAGDKMEVVVGNRSAMIATGDDSVVTMVGNMSQLVVAGSFTTTVTAGAHTTNVVAGARTSVVGGLDSSTSGSMEIMSGATTIETGATDVTTGALLVDGASITLTSGATTISPGGVITVGTVSGVNWGYGIGNVKVT